MIVSVPFALANIALRERQKSYPVSVKSILFR
jgi:hypothetical protein